MKRSSPSVYVNKIRQTLKDQIHIRSRRFHWDPQPHEAATKRFPPHHLYNHQGGRGKEMCSPDRMIRAIELISASALGSVRVLEQAYLLLRRSQKVKQTEAISVGQIFVCPSSRISRTARDRKSPTRPSKAPRSAKSSTGNKKSQHQHIEKTSNEIPRSSKMEKKRHGSTHPRYERADQYPPNGQ